MSLPSLQSLLTAPAARKGHHAGTHRTRSPQETFEDYRRWMPRLGITRVANITGLDHVGLPVFQAIRPNARGLSTSQGKGIDEASARTSALMESIEWWHAEHIDSAHLRWDSYARMRRGPSVVAPSELAPRASVAEDLPTLWIEGFCLMTQQAVWVPFDLVSLCGTGEVRLKPLRASSNGLASGNRLVEAVVHGLCEVIERHSDTQRQPSADPIDPRSAPEGPCAEVLERIARADLLVHIWERTWPAVGVPTYGCVVFERGGRRSRLLGGYRGTGSHLSAEIALSRALTEAVQARLTYIAGSRDDTRRSSYSVTQSEVMHDINIDTLGRPRSLASFEPVSLARDTLNEDLATLLRRLEGAGVRRAVVVDLTREEMGIPVVKVLVPGLTMPSSDAGF